MQKMQLCSLPTHTRHSLAAMDKLRNGFTLFFGVGTLFLGPHLGCTENNVLLLFPIWLTQQCKIVEETPVVTASKFIAS